MQVLRVLEVGFGVDIADHPLTNRMRFAVSHREHVGYSMILSFCTA